MSATKPWFAHYEKGVPQVVEIPNVPVQQLLSDAAAKYPNKTAVRMVLKYLPLGIAVQAKLRYSELERMSSKFAAALATLGVVKGTKVAVMLPNMPQHTVAYFGILKAGGVVVNVNPTYPAHELEPLMRAAGAEVIITLSGLYERVLEIQPNTSIKSIILTDVPEMVTKLLQRRVAETVKATGMMKDLGALKPGTYWMKNLMAQAPAQAPSVKIDVKEDAAVFQFTGGTTGVPKAAELTHYNLVANTYQLLAWVPGLVPGQEKMLMAIPAFHVYGMTVGMLLAFALGGELVVVPNPRETLHVMEVLQREKITLYPGVPAMYIAIINHPKVVDYDLRSVKVCLSGSAALPVEVAQKWEEITGGKLVEGFGMSECSPVATANPIFGQVRVGSIGLPLPDTECAVVSLEMNEAGEYQFLASGQEGEIVVRGPQVMKGYYSNKEETAKTIDKDGWLHTGDIAKMDKDGYFYIVDRKKDLIIAGGYNIVPREVEEVLFMHPKVMEAAVIGVPDAKRGEVVKAFVVLKDGATATADEIRSFCKEKLAPYKVPSNVEFRKELPKTQVGKVLRRTLLDEEKAKMSAKSEPEKVA
jgi:long-chain acyl-CoA synthetase